MKYDVKVNGEVWYRCESQETANKKCSEIRKQMDCDVLVEKVTGRDLEKVDKKRCLI